MRTAPRIAAAAALLALAAIAPAQAATKRMVTYDSTSADARRLTGAGLTFVFTKSMIGATRILAIRATAVPVGVIPRPLNDGDTVRKLDALMGEDARTGTLYEIDPDAAEGKVMVQAFCPGAKTGWLSIGPIAHQREMRVHAFGADETGEARLCAVMDFAWRGEWRMPNPNTADITQRVMRPDYVRTPGS